MACALVSTLTASSINNCFHACIFDDIVEGVLGFDPKRMEVVNSNHTLCPFI